MLTKINWNKKELKRINNTFKEATKECRKSWLKKWKNIELMFTYSVNGFYVKNEYDVMFYPLESIEKTGINKDLINKAMKNPGIYVSL